MSFLKNLRSSVSRKNSERSTKEDLSVIQIKLKNNNNKEKNQKDKNITKDNRCIEVEGNQSESGVLRCDTYTIIDENGQIVVQGNNQTSPLLASPPKRNMFSKFGTFTRRKKAQTPKKEVEIPQEESILDNSKNNSILNDVPVSFASNSDPFNIFYQQSGVTSRKSSVDQESLNYGTYRKNKLSNNVKDQLQELHLESQNVEEKPQNESDKYKTVTLRSFRKSFKDKFLTQQKDVPYNPSWFVEVDYPKEEKSEIEDDPEQKRRELLTFEIKNESFRPSARSPIRNLLDRSPIRTRSKTPVRSPSTKSTNTTSQPTSRSRSTTRSSLRKTHNVDGKGVSRDIVDHIPDRSSPQRYSLEPKTTVSVKRNETFKVERESPKSSIRIEIKNSISPNEPGRIVPVGVAKPMLSSSPNESFESGNIRPRSPLRDYTERQSRSGSKNRNKIYITGSSNTHSDSSSQRTRPLRSQVYVTHQSQNSGLVASALTSQKTSRTPKAPIITNYLPLTSYELLTKMKPRSGIQQITSNDRSKFISQDPLTRSSGQYRGELPPNSSNPNVKQWNQSTVSSSNKQKTSIYIGKNPPVRKDNHAFNNNQISGSNKRRLRIKMPWK